MRRFSKCCKTQSATAQPRESTWSARMVLLTVKRLKGSGRFTNAKASLASSAARASDGSCTARDQLTGVRDVNDDDYPQTTQIIPTGRGGKTLIVRLPFTPLGVRYL